MKNKKKKILIISIILIVLIIIIYNIFNNDKSEVNKLIYNKNKSFTKEQLKDGVTFKNIKCYYDGKDSMISYIISNQTDKEIDLKNYKVYVKDKKGTVITNIYVDFSKKLAPKEEMQYRNSIVGVDLSNAYSMELKLNNK